MTNALLRRTLNAPFLLIATLAILACSFAVPNGAADATASQSDPEASFEQRVNDTLNLRASEVVTLDIDTTPGIERSMVVAIGGEDYTLNLSPYSTRAEGYQVLMEYPDGEIVEFEPSRVRTVRGSVAELPGSMIAGSVLDDGLHVVIMLDEEDTYWIEPLGDRVAGAVEGEHAVYHVDDVIPSDGLCGNDAADMQEHLEQAQPGGDTRQAMGGVCGVTDLACDADEPFLNAHGGTVQGVENRINLVINLTNQQYENQVEITHLISAILIHTNPPGTLPGSGTEGENTYPYTSSDPVGLLNQFRNHWLSTHGNIQRDVTHLFTGVNINGGVIGIAFDLGVICTSNAYCLSQSDCCGSLGCAADLTAHELGHLWNGIHCDPCSTTMRSFIGCFLNFGAMNIGRITNHRNSRNCLECPEGATTPLPFFDDFPTGTINPDLWTGVDGAVVSGLGQNEPSPPFSLNIDHLDEARSAVMDTSGTELMVVSYWWQQTGGGGEPGAGEDLIVEYHNSQENWIELNSHLGADPGSNQFEFVEIPLTGGARHSDFRLRFRSTGNSTQDDWYIDDVFVGTPPEDATTTLPFIDDFASTEIDSDLWIGIEGASIDDQGAGEPSPIYSLNIDGVDEIRSANMDTTGGFDLTLSYWWQQTGDGGDAPESNDPLIVEYQNDEDEWVEINSHPGAGPDAEPYALEILPLPSDALHANFRVQFRGTGTTGGAPEGFDDWFVDNVCVGTVGECQVGDPCGDAGDCNDGIPCTTDDCLSNFCVHIPANAACDDGIACTADACIAGIGCENTPNDAACDDGDGCTLDSCDAGSGCVNAPDVGAPCDDGLECTINDACDAEGACTGEGDNCVFLEAALADLPICQDTSQDEIDEPLDVCHVYVRLIAANDQLLSVGFSDISTTDPNGFFQHPFGGNTSPACNLLPVFPALACDSFATIGVTCDDGSDASSTDPDFDGCAFNCDNIAPGCEDNTLCGEVHGGWFNADPGNDQGDPDENLRVLIAQLSVAQGQSVSGTLSAFVRIGDDEPPDIVAFPGLEFECVGGTTQCNLDCPTDVDFDGQTAPFDLAFLLGCWGPVAPGSACACLDADNDGEIGPFDLAVLLGIWGPCI